MERKYYLRGLGLGIVVTAIIMGMMLSGKEKMSDEDVIARAKELGMVEDTVLSDSINDAKEEAAAAAEAEASKEPETETKSEPENSKQPDTAKNDTSVNSKTQTDDAVKAADTAKTDTDKTTETAKADTSKTTDKTTDAAKTETAKADTDKTTTAAKAETAANKANNTEPTTITVGSGDGSYTVAKKLADAGVVSSAQSYDEYLCSNGYDKKLRTGTFTIPANATEEQIAKIVTGPGD
jgi:outer membrane biosynthesis protein TonB